MPDQNFNVWNSFTQGMGLADNFRRMQDDERQRRRMVEQDQAMQLLAQQPYIPGYEGVKGAEMVPWLADTFRSNPELAMKLGHEIAAPYAMQRDIEKAKGIEQGKTDIHLNMVMDAAKRLGLMRGSNPGSNIFQVGYNPQQAPFPGGDLSPLAPIEPQAPESLDDLSGASTRIKLDKNGPEFSFDSMSPLEMAAKRGHLRVEQGNLKVNEGNLKLAQEEQPDRRAKTTADLVRSQTQNEQDAMLAMNNIHSEMYKIHADDTIDPRTKEALLSEIRPLYQQAQKRMLDITKGLGKLSTNVEDYGAPRRDTPDPNLQASMEGTGSTTAQPQVAAPTAPRRPSGAAGNPEIGAGLPYKRKMEVQQKATEQKVELSTKSIGEAHAAADKFNSHMPSINRLFDLVSKKELGNRLAQIPGGETAARLWSQDNDELQKLRNELIDTQKQEGQSQLMNTLPELAIQSDALPSVTNGPDVNRRSMVNLRNLADARLAAPGFLENWAQQHGGTIDGARQVFREWMQNNPLYKAEEVNGRVTVNEHDGYIPIDAWTRLKQRFSTQEIVKKREAGNIQVINGRVFFKE